MSEQETEPLVAVTIVTFNSARYIATCLDHVLLQDHRRLEIVIIDNDSRDETVRILAQYSGHPQIRVVLNKVNTGFAGGQNQAIAAAAGADWILTLNPDVRLSSSFISTLLDSAESGPRIGSLCGKLRSAAPDWTATDPPLLDSTGIYFTPNFRHLDRGSRRPDVGQYETEEYVAGGTAAACLYRRSMIEDISIAGEFFDSDFFAYREDADVAWRAQLLGWRALYVPRAVAYHVRSVVPENRASLPAFINRHSVKNRWLMRIKNVTPSLYRRFWLPVTVRDIVVIGGCLLREWSSLGAFVQVARLWPKMMAKRRWIMRRRRASESEIAAWFADKPASVTVQKSERER